MSATMENPTTMENPAPYQMQLPQHLVVPGSSPVFEFTKRKKWDDILFSELHLSLVLVLTPDSRLLFAGISSALEDVLGYNQEHVLNTDFADLLHPQDAPTWRSLISDATTLGPPSPPSTGDRVFSVFLRMRRNPDRRSSAFQSPWPSIPSDHSVQHVVFEIRGHLHYPPSSPGTSSPKPSCIVAIATPYPSLALDMFNSFFEHKLEHERLLQRFRELTASTANGPENASTSNLNALPHRLVPPPSPYSLLSSLGPLPPSLALDDDENENLQRKKPRKQAHQYVCVTCGRTDSPEWRRGPKGPKTLCNACGLRWAKNSRKGENTASVAAAPVSSLAENHAAANPLGVRPSATTGD